MDVGIFLCNSIPDSFADHQYQQPGKDDTPLANSYLCSWNANLHLKQPFPNAGGCKAITPRNKQALI